MEERLKTFLIFVVLLATALKVVKSRAVGRTKFGDQNALREFFHDVADFGTEAPETEDSSENNVKNELQNSERIDPFEFSDLSIIDEDMDLSDEELEYEEDDSNSQLRNDVPGKFNRNSRKHGKYDIDYSYSLSESNQLPDSLKNAKVPEQTTNNKWISKPGTSSVRSTSFDGSFTDPVDIPSSASRKFENDPPVMEDRKKFGDFNGSTISENPVASDDKLSQLIAQVFQENHNGGELEQNSSFGEDSSSLVAIPSTVTEGFESNPPTMDDRRKFGDFNGFTPPENPASQTYRPLSTVIPDANRKENGDNVDHSSSGGNSFNQDFTNPVDIPSTGGGGFGRNPPTMDDRRKFGDFNGFTPPENPGVENNGPSSESMYLPPLSTVIPGENRKQDGEDLERSTNRGNSFNQDFTDPIDIHSAGSGGFDRNPPTMGDRRKFGDFNGFTPPENTGVENHRPTSESMYLPPLSTVIPGENRKQYGQELDRSTNRGNSFNQDFTDAVDIPSPGSGGFGRNPPTMDDRRKFGDFNGFTPPENPGVENNGPSSESMYLPPLSTVIPGENRKQDGEDLDRSTNRGNSFNQDFMDPIDIPSAGSGGFDRNPPTMGDRRKFGDFNGFTPPENPGGVENNGPSSESMYLPPLSTVIPGENRKQDGEDLDRSTNRGNSFNQDFTDPIDIPSAGSGGFDRNPPTMGDRRKFGDFNGFTPPENPGVENNRPTSESDYLPPLSTGTPGENRKQYGQELDRSTNRGNSFNQDFTDAVDIPSPGSGGFGRNPPTMDDRRKFGDFNGFTPPENPGVENNRPSSESDYLPPLSTVIPGENRKQYGRELDRSTNRGNTFNQGFTDPADISSPGSGGFGRNPPTMNDRRKFGDFNGFTPPENPGVENNSPTSESMYLPPLSTVVPGKNRKQYGQELDRSTNRGNSFNQDFTDAVDIPSPGSGGFGRNPPTMDDRRKFGDFNGFTPPENPAVQRNRPTSESIYLPPLSTVIPQSNRKEGEVGRSFDGSRSYNEDITHPVDIPSAGSDGFGRNPPAMDDRRKFGNFNGFAPAYNVRNGGHPRHVKPPYESGQFRQPHYFNQPIGGFHSHGYHGNYRPPPFGGHTHTTLSGPSGHYDYNTMGSVQHAPHRHNNPLPQPYPRPHPHNGMHYLPPVNYNRPIPFNGNSNGNFRSSYRG